MKRILLPAIIMLLLISTAAGAIIEEDWGNYTKADKTDNSGNNITLNFLRKSYTDAEEKYTVTIKDFDSSGIVVLDVNYMGRYERVMLKGEWDETRTKIILTEPLELFNKTMVITPIKIVPPAGIFTCCPEAKININILKPEIKIDLNEDKRSSTSEYRLVNPFASLSNWSGYQYVDPYDDSFADIVNATIDLRPENSYRMYEQIPLEINVTNNGDAEISGSQVFIDSDGLLLEYGQPYYQLPTLIGEDQKNIAGIKTQFIKLKFRFPSPPSKLKYEMKVYVKGTRSGTTYYNVESKTINLLPSASVQKSVTKESMLLSRKEIEKVYPSIDPDEISRWLLGGEIFVTVGVTNYQNYEIKGMKLSDVISRQFTTQNASLNWTFDLKPLETKEFKYKITTVRPGRYGLPPALLSYSEFNMPWSLLSNTPSTEIHGPCMQVFKRPDKPVVTKGENTTVTLTISNSGDMPSRVKVIDKLPQNTTLINGSTDYEGSILPQDSAIFSYSIAINETGQITLPDPGLYVNGRDNMSCGEPLLSKILVREPQVPAPTKNVTVPVRTPVRTPITTPALPLTQYSWIDGIIPALLLILAIAVLLILHRLT